jgi:hypothetical protein
MDSALPKPHSSAISSIGWEDSSSLRRAASTRTCKTKRAGVTPICSAKTRAKLRGLILACAAIRSTVRCSRRLFSSQTCKSRIGARSEACSESEALNCDWLPGRRRKTTRARATSSASSGPQSSSTSASDKSIPAVTPAEV